MVGKTAYIFGGSSGCGYGERQNGVESEPVYLNDLFSLKGEACVSYNNCTVNCLEYFLIIIIIVIINITIIIIIIINSNNNYYNTNTTLFTEGDT